MPYTFEVVYNSDLIIRDPAEAATLCLFYDRVFLPHTSATTSGQVVSADPSRDLGITYHSPYEIKDWELRYGTLFDEGVVARLSPSPHEIQIPKQEPRPITVKTVKKVKKDVTNVRRVYAVDHNMGLWVSWGGPIDPNDKVGEGDQIIGEGVETCACYPFSGTGYSNVELMKIGIPYKTVTRQITIKPDSESATLGENGAKPETRSQKFDIDPSAIPALRVEESNKERYVRADLIYHQIRRDIELPQIYSSLTKPHFTRDVMIALEARAVFKYLLPKIHVADPSQILELRKRVADTREGFAMHLQKLSKGLEERTRESVALEEVGKFAKNLIETELIPDYREFRRQLEMINAGKWKPVFDPLSQLVEVDAPIWSPKSLSLLFKAMGLSLIQSLAEQREQLSNRYQAFQFMGSLESPSAAWL